MHGWSQSWKFVIASGAVYLAILFATGELRRSSKALVFFLIVWLIQSVAALWRARRERKRAV